MWGHSHVCRRRDPSQHARVIRDSGEAFGIVLDELVAQVVQILLDHPTGLGAVVRGAELAPLSPPVQIGVPQQACEQVGPQLVHLAVEAFPVDRLLVALGEDPRDAGVSKIAQIIGKRVHVRVPDNE